MSDKDKWKTYPCKECLIRYICKQECFKWPTSANTVAKHIRENNLQYVCMRCGDMLSNNNWWCDTCENKLVSY